MLVLRGAITRLPFSCSFNVCSDSQLATIWHVIIKSVSQNWNENEMVIYNIKNTKFTYALYSYVHDQDMGTPPLLAEDTDPVVTGS